MEIEQELDTVENVRPKKKNRYVLKKMRHSDDDYLSMKNLRALYKKNSPIYQKNAYEGDICNQSPIRLQGENALGYEMIRQYI